MNHLFPLSLLTSFHVLKTRLILTEMTFPSLRFEEEFSLFALGLTTPLPSALLKKIHPVIYPEDDPMTHFVPDEAKTEVLENGAAFAMAKVDFYHLQSVAGSKDREFLRQCRYSRERAFNVSRRDLVDILDCTRTHVDSLYF